MITVKKYLSIKEVSQLINIKEHVIRHWDSIDPKTKKLRVEGLSLRTKGGTRYFNRTHIKKISILNNILKDNGKRNYSLDLASKILDNKAKKTINNVNELDKDMDSIDLSQKIAKIRNITNNLKKLLLR
jgi:DNA-binding transcriptional MerR regulator